MLVDYIEKVENEKRFDVVLLSGDCFEPGQLAIALKLLKRGTGMWGTKIFPIRFNVYNEWYKEKEPFVGLETDEATRSISQKDLLELVRNWKTKPSQSDAYDFGQSNVYDINGKRVVISDWLYDTEGCTVPDKPVCTWHSDDYVRGWNDCLDEVFNSGMA